MVLHELVLNYVMKTKNAIISNKGLTFRDKPLFLLRHFNSYCFLPSVAVAEIFSVTDSLNNSHSAKMFFNETTFPSDLSAL